MNPTTLRRLISEHRSLHSSPLPPNYLFPPTSSTSSGVPDDLTQLSVLLAGPQGTPYAQGLWKVQLKMPEDYPQSPPKAVFRTKIWHPNVDESTGAVCVDTLKRDWSSELTMRDILVTISCLLIHPNPDSALNSSAGHLLQEDYEAFAGQAKLMTSIHAPVPQNLREAVAEAKNRGEEQEGATPATETSRTPRSRPVPHAGARARYQVTLPQRSLDAQRQQEEAQSSDEEDENGAAASKENDPSLSPTPVSPMPPSPRKNGSKKRPLSTLPTPVDPDVTGDESGFRDSDQNIANNTNIHTDETDVEQAWSGSRKSPKLSEGSPGANASGRVRIDADEGMGISLFTDDGVPDAQPLTASGTTKATTSYPEGKENMTEVDQPKASVVTAAAQRVAASSILGVATSPVASRKPPAGSQSNAKNSKSGKPRVGLRRL